MSDDKIISLPKARKARAGEQENAAVEAQIKASEDLNRRLSDAFVSWTGDHPEFDHPEGVFVMFWGLMYFFKKCVWSMSQNEVMEAMDRDQREVIERLDSILNEVVKS